MISIRSIIYLKNFAIKYLFYVLLIVVILIVLIRYADKDKGIIRTVNYLTVNLISIKEIQDLHISEYIISTRQFIVFDKYGIPDQKNTIRANDFWTKALLEPVPIAAITTFISSFERYIDYIAVISVKVVVPLDKIVETTTKDNKNISIDIPEIVVKRGNIDRNRSFTWDEKRQPDNALKIASYMAEKSIIKELDKFIRFDDIRNETETIFKAFYHTIGFETVNVNMPDHWTIDATGQSTDIMFDIITDLAKSQTSLIETGYWYINPIFPEEKIRFASSYKEFQNVSEEKILFYDTHGKGKTGLILTKNALYWRNPYRLFKDSERFNISLEEFSEVNLWFKDNDSKIFINRTKEDESIFFDCRDKEQAGNILIFLQDLQKIIKQTHETPTDETIIDDELEKILLQMEEEQPV